MKKLLQILVAIPIVLVVWFAEDIAEDIAWDTAGDIARAIPIVNDFIVNFLLTEEAKKLNKNLPMMEDSETRWDSTIGINKQFRYNLTMINFLESEMDVPAFKQRMLLKLRNYVCTTEEMNFFVSNDVPVTYAYFDNEGKQFAIITIQPTDCSSSVPDLFIY
tara:strand:- start:78 stop:563 length:486 start_codon:yes stop_codon:yes gene_type:complete